MIRLKLMLATAMVACLSLMFAGSAFAAKASCGDCHGTHNGATKTFSSTTAWHNLRSGYTPAIYEVGYTPVDADTCNNDGRGLHGIHMNYSSAIYGKKGGTSGVVRGNCDYCHYKKLHQSGFVEISGTSTALVAGRQTVTDPNLDYDFGTKTCTNACHKNAASTAPWGNYTSPSIALGCTSCHDDGTNGSAGLSSPANYGHKIHLTGSWLGSGSNKTMIVMGSYSGYLNSADNTACQFCHPDNRNDRYSQGRADDGTVKAYPHASDGTNVKSKNATFNANVALANWTGTYMAPMCTTSCHVQQSSAQVGYAKWDGTKINATTFSNCEICHQHKASAAINISSNRPLTYAHAIHFANLSTSAGRVSCSACHLGVHTNYAGVSMITRLPVTPGNAGMLATMNWSRNGAAAVDGTCQNSCHIVASPAWNTIATNGLTPVSGCSACHEYPGGSRDWTGDNGHMVRNAATATRQLTHLRDNASYSATADTYAGVTGDVNLCGKCHSGGTHMNGSVNVADTNTLGLCSGTSFTFNATTPGTDVSCSNVKCHNGRTTPNWW